MKSIWIALISLASAVATFAQSDSASMQGFITAPDGSPIAGAYVTAVGAYIAQFPQGPPQSQTYSALTTGTGQFTFAAVNPGSYTMCVHAPKTVYLDPCVWASGPVQTVVPGQVVTDVDITLNIGAILRVQVNDPGQHLSKRHGSVLLGVSSPSLSFHALDVASNSATGALFEIAVPLNVALQLEISSNRLQLADAKGAAITAAASATPILLSDSQSVTVLNVSITGTK